MASRAQQKEEARQRRLAEEQARTARASRQRRLQMLLGVIVAAVVVAVVAVVISTQGGTAKSGPSPQSPAAKAQAAAVDTLLAGIPQSGNRLGSPSAKVTVTEFGDLECPICRDFALSAENQLIQNDVRSGKVALVYKSLCTATCNGPNASLFPAQQAAAIAAGQQNKQWYYIELFYHEQGTEDTSYVNDSYLNGLADQVPGLNFATWSSARTQSALSAQVTADEQQAASQGYNSTPTLVVSGPKGPASPIVGDTDYNTLEQAIKSVS
jgi:protein-disulfide isomerase